MEANRPPDAPRRTLFSRFWPPVVGVGVFLAAWTGLARQFRPDQLPGPREVVYALTELAADGRLLEGTGVSLGRFSLGYSLAVVLGIPLGLFLGWHARSLQAAGPILQVLRPISPIAWMPLAVLWFGIGNAPAVFIILLAAIFPIVLTTVRAVQTVPASYLKFARNFGTPRLMLFCHVIVPASFPTIMIGLRIAVGTGWIHLVAGEMLGARSGLGFLIMDARNFLRTDLMVAAMLTIGVLGLLMDRAMSVAEHAITRHWGTA